MTPMLFEPLRMRGLTLPNRIAISPMCQYSAVDGSATDWHLVHLPAMAMSGAGLMTVEATAVDPRGRITPECLGLWNDANEQALVRPIELVRKFSNIPLAMQLGHAGRKASTRKPWSGRGFIGPENGGWRTVGPSAIGFDETHAAPEELDRAGMDEVIAAFVTATQRAQRLGFDAVELHGAHGYLISSFLSPLANHRGDQYGGSFANRSRFPLEIFAAIRAEWPEDKPMGVRLNGTDWVNEGITTDEAVEFTKALAAIGCDYVDVSSGGNAKVRVPAAPGYQVPFAARIKAETKMITMAVGLIRDPHHAEAILQRGEADVIALGRAILNNPRWPWHAAEDLGVSLRNVPPQYERGLTRAGTPGTLEGASLLRRP